MDLFLFANFFPYKKAEPFLSNEIKFAKQNSSSLTVFTLYGKPSDLSADVKGIHLLPPVFESSADKKQIFRKGIFNLSPFNFHFSEFLRKLIFLSPKKIYWFFVSLMVTRSVLSSPAYKELIRSVNASKAPVLYFYWGDNLVWILPYLKKKINPRAKIIVRLHGSDLYEHLKAGYAPLRSKIFQAANALFTVSETGCKYLSEKYPAFLAKISVARLGVNDFSVGPVPENKITVVSVSNVVALKRVQLIFEALQELDLEITWHHFGDGPLFNELKEEVKTRRKSLAVNLHGYVSNADIIKFYETTPVNIFVNVSTSEGVPVSVMEAFSFGIPVIATNAGGTAELVNNNNGILLDIDIDRHQLARAMAQFFQLSFEEVQTKRRKARVQFEEKSSAEKNYSAFYRKIDTLKN